MTRLLGEHLSWCAFLSDAGKFNPSEKDIPSFVKRVQDHYGALTKEDRKKHGYNAALCYKEFLAEFHQNRQKERAMVTRLKDLEFALKIIEEKIDDIKLVVSFWRNNRYDKG